MFVASLVLFVLAAASLLLGFKKKFGTHKMAQNRVDDPAYPRGFRIVDEKVFVENKGPNKLLKLIGAGLAGLGIIILATQTFYAQDPGEAKVLRSVTGAVVGSDTTQGFSTKAPWVAAINFDIRNQTASFIGNGSDDYQGGRPDGAQITSADKQGGRVDMDVTVTYSIAEAKVIDIYNAYQSEANFKDRMIERDVRAVARIAPAKYSAAELNAKRAEITADIEKALSERWADKGVSVEAVALQEFRFDEATTAKLTESLNSETQKTIAKNNLIIAETDAQQKIVIAEAEAKANDLLAKSLSPEVLTQRYYDSLVLISENGGMMAFVPEGSQPMVGSMVPATKQP